MYINANGNPQITFTNHNGTQTMEVFTIDGVPSMIEWDIPDLDETEHIGLWFEDKKLVDYDGIAYYMPIQAIELVESLGYNMNYARTDIQECWECDAVIPVTPYDDPFCSDACKNKWYPEG